MSDFWTAWFFWWMIPGWYISAGALLFWESCVIAKCDPDTSVTEEFVNNWWFWIISPIGIPLAFLHVFLTRKKSKWYLG